jgi:glycerophosphoryl diester phosphodiesterase
MNARRPRTAVLTALAALVGIAGAAAWKRIRGDSSASPKHTSRRMRFVGHRGASAIAPENTLQAVNLALAVGAGFEVDLQARPPADQGALPMRSL